MRHGDTAWVVLGAGILAYELAAVPDELMSDAADRWMVRHPWLVRAVAFTVAAHVANTIPNTLDPLHWLFRAKRLIR